MSIFPKSLTATGLMDERTGFITAYINEFPGIVVQGKSEDDVNRKLDMLLDAFIKRLQASRNNLEIETQTI